MITSNLIGIMAVLSNKRDLFPMYVEIVGDENGRRNTGKKSGNFQLERKVQGQIVGIRALSNTLANVMLALYLMPVSNQKPLPVTPNGFRS